MYIDPDVDHEMDAALAGLEGLDELPVADHVAKFDAVHTVLSKSLSAIDTV